MELKTFRKLWQSSPANIERNLKSYDVFGRAYFLAAKNEIQTPDEVED